MSGLGKIRIPVDTSYAISDKVQPLKYHWLEITCPCCGKVSGGGNEINHAIFYGEKVMSFYCYDCNECEEDMPAYMLEGIEDGFAIISKAPNFTGRIEHCFFQKHVGGSI